MRKKVTIYEISKEAGVSTCCVSWVLRNHPRSSEVSEKTRRRILETAEKLGYHRNQLAAAVRIGKVNTIAVILNFEKYQSITSFCQIMAGVMLEASRLGLSVKVFSDSDLDIAFRQINENLIDQVIMLSVNYQVRDRAAELAEKFSIKLVYAYERGHRNFPAVNVDNVEITSRMVHHLAAEGHRRIGLLCVPHQSNYVIDRHDGFILGMKECNLTIDPELVHCSDDIENSLKYCMELPVDRRPTAFVALSDTIAAKVQAYALRNKLRFPEDISVIGIGDFEISRMQPFPLTTMGESLLEVGHLLVTLLRNEAMPMQPDGCNVYHTHAELIRRESVCKLN